MLEQDNAAFAEINRLKEFEEYGTQGLYKVDMIIPVQLDLPPDELIKQINKNSVISDVNNFLARMYGVLPEQMIGHLKIEFDPNFGKQVLSVLKSENNLLFNEETVIIAKNGKVIYLLEDYHGIVKNKHLVSIWGTQKDISNLKVAEKKKNALEFQLKQSQKMRAVGTLAGGIAHDFNNFLSVILGYTEMLKDEASEGSSLYESLERILEAGHRASELINQILIFSRKSDVNKLPLNPQPIIKKALRMLESSFTETIEIKSEIDSDCGFINADPTQLYQIIMNLATNSVHAMEKDGGILTIGLKTAVNIPLSIHTDKVGASDFIELTVHDTGHGISSDIIDDIYNPFFTTKVKGKGTGMGLAITYGIISNYGGAIQVESEQGTGTLFSLYFPKSNKEFDGTAIIE